MATARQRQRTRDKRRRHEDKVSGKTAARKVAARQNEVIVLTPQRVRGHRATIVTHDEVATSMRTAAAAEQGDCRTVHAGLAVESFEPSKSVDDMTKGELLAYADVIHVKVSKWWTRGKMIDTLKEATS